MSHPHPALCRNARLALALAAGLGVASVVVADPSSPPAPSATADRSPARRAAGPALTDRNSVEFASEVAGASFRVPKGWERVRVTGDPQTDGQLFHFDAAPNAPDKPMRADQRFTVSVGQPCHPGSDVRDVAHVNRDRMLQLEPELKFTRDEAIDFAGHPAWVLARPREQVFTFSGPGAPPEVRFLLTEQHVYWLHGDEIASLWFEGDKAAFPKLERAARQIGETVAWIDDATPKPAAAPGEQGAAAGATDGA